MFGIETTRRSGRHPPPGRLPARRVHAVRQADRRPDHRVLRQPAGRGRSRPTRPTLIARLDIDPTRRFREYSKGNKQKIGLVIALQHRPELLILDEPTSGLDPLVQQTFYEIIREAKTEGRTVFLSSHVLSEVERTCDRVAIIRDGGLVKRRPDRGPAGPGPPPGRAAVRRRGAVGGVREPAGVSQLEVDGQHSQDAGVRVDRAGRPGRRLVRPPRLRQPRTGLEETFLAEYSDAAEGGLTWRPTFGRRRSRRARATVSLWSRLYGFGSIYAKTVRDSRLAFIIVAGMLGGMMLVAGAGVGAVYSTPESRADMVASPPRSGRSSRA